jgi:aminopeptidase N
MEDSLDNIVMDNYVMNFDSVFIDDEAAEFQSNATSLTITLPEGISTGDTIVVNIAYHGVIRPDNATGAMMYNQRRDNLYTFGEPYRTRGWVVCYDKPFDKVTSTMIVTLPNEYKVLSNGQLTSIEDVGDDMNRTTWTNEYPISTYLLSVCAAPYTILELESAGENDTPLEMWALPGDSAAVMASMGNTGEMLEYFESLFGPYPFSKYSVGESALNLNEEHQTSTSMQEAVSIGGDRFEWIIAHELAHQWWGNKIGPITFDDIWLNEGLTTYCDRMWMGRNNDETFYAWMNQAADRYFQEDERVRYAIYDPPFSYIFGSAIYNKGAWVMHMLRYVLGDEDFFAGWRIYGDAYAYGSATTSELQAALEEASEMDLTDFFEQWVYRGGYPIYSVTNFDVIEAEDGSFAVEFDIEQRQTRAPLYTLPLQFAFSDGESDTMVQFDMAEEVTQHLMVEGLTFEPDKYDFDPNNWVLSSFEDNTAVDEDSPALPTGFSLSSAYPNPFNSTAVIEYNIPYQSEINLAVYNQLGQMVQVLAQGSQGAGTQTAVLYGTDLPTGLYFIRLEGAGVILMKKIVLMK